MNIEYITRTDISLWRTNPRKNNKAAIDLAKVILQNGVRTPVVLWKKNMTAYKGNTTIKALDIINAGKDYTVPCVLHDFADEARAIAYGIADNKSSEYAEWDTDLLASMFASTSVPLARPATGFKEIEIMELFDFEKKEKLMLNTGSKITLSCEEGDREEILSLLHDWADQSGFKNIGIK